MSSRSRVASRDDANGETMTAHWCRHFATQLPTAESPSVLAGEARLRASGEELSASVPPPPRASYVHSIMAIAAERI